MIPDMMSIKKNNYKYFSDTYFEGNMNRCRSFSALPYARQKSEEIYLPSGEDSGRSKVSSDFYGNYFCSRKLGWPKRKFDDKEILTIFYVPSLVCTFTLWTRSLFHNNNLFFLKWNVISAENGNKVDLENLNCLRFT